MLLFRLLILFCFMFVLPMLFGYTIKLWSKTAYKSIITSFAFCYVMGSFLLWASFQVFAVPFIYFKQKLTALEFVWLGLIVVLSIVAIYLILKKYNARPICQITKCIRKYSEKHIIDKLIDIMCLLVLGFLIAFQCYKYLRYAHVDDDDSRFVVNAVDAYLNNTMLLTNPITGEATSTWIGDLHKDVSSPWPIFIAVLAKISGVYPTIVAHSVMPVFLLGASYLAVWLIAREVFGEDLRKITVMVSVVAFVNMYFNKAVRTQSCVTLHRIWQGKAVVGAVVIPFLFFLLLRLYEEYDNKKIYVMLTVVGAGASLLSAVGILIPAVMIGTFGIYYNVINKMWKNIIYVMLSCMPTIVFGVIAYIV